VARRLEPQQLARLSGNWYGLMDAVETDPRYSATTQLSSANGRLRAAKALAADGKLPAAVAAQARKTLDAFLARGYDGYARAGIINSASGILDKLGEHARLKALLEEQIKVSKTPYYYYPDIGDIEEAAGHKAEALDWFERGYRESRGAATRFQWGAIYVNALLRISPQDEPRIRAAALDVLGELDGPDRIHARARSRLESLDAALNKWAGTTNNVATLAVIGQRWRQVCQGLPAADPVRTECPKLVAAGA
jgi:tetratricopeptide (TPR) repeat protein